MTTSSSSQAYAQAGVDIAEGDRAVQLMQDAVKATYTPAVLAGIGAFGGMMDAAALKAMQAPVLVASTDGVGTKTMVAQAVDRWDSIGEDLVNHSVNDILVQGAQPLFFMDYVASAKLQAERVAAIVSGMARACRRADCVLLGGETAEMPGVYHADHWDVAGTIVGVVERSAVLDGSRIAIGDAVLALPSSGLHTNGYSLARKVLEGLDWTLPVAQLARQGQLELPALTTPAQQQDAQKSLGDLLLAVHVSYLQPYRALCAAAVAVHGMVHITGGGLQENMPRVLPEHASALIAWRSWPVPLIFDILVRRGQLALQEQQQVFNMGVGMVLIVPATAVAQVERVLGAHAYSRIGSIVARDAHAAALMVTSAAR